MDSISMMSITSSTPLEKRFNFLLIVVWWGFFFWCERQIEMGSDLNSGFLDILVSFDLFLDPWINFD
jgi:hypothetical protein